jgi:integrase
MLFMLLTLARLEEVCGAPWREIDLSGATWTIPPERTKNGKQHIIPLSRQAVALLRQMGNREPDTLVLASRQSPT